MPTLENTETSDWDPESRSAGSSSNIDSQKNRAKVALDATRVDSNQNSTNPNSSINQDDSDFELTSESSAEAKTIAEVDQNIGKSIIVEMNGTRHSLRLISLIGIGGMGKVYEGISVSEPNLIRLAVKLAKRTKDSNKVNSRFELESSVLKQLRHPNIVKFNSDGVMERGNRFIAMDLIDGPNIVEYAKRRQLSVSDKIDLFAKVCDAVSYCHQQGIIHRDIKPTNILVEESSEEPILIDFGVVKILDESNSRISASGHQSSSAPSTDGQLVGTIQYMSPEQAQRNEAAVDQRTDVYSLGVLLYELLSGNPPISRQELREHSLESIVAKICEEKDPLAFDLAGIDHVDNNLHIDDLSSVLSIAISSDMDERFSTVSEFKNKLLAVAHGNSVSEIRDVTLHPNPGKTRQTDCPVTSTLNNHWWQAISLCLILALCFAFRSNSSDQNSSAKNSDDEVLTESSFQFQFCDGSDNLEIQKELEAPQAPQMLRGKELQFEEQRIEKSLYVMEQVEEKAPQIKRIQHKRFLAPRENKVEWMIKPAPQEFFVDAKQLKKDVQLHAIEKFNYVIEKLDGRSFTQVKKLIERIPNNALHKCMFRIGPLENQQPIRLSY